MRVVGLQVSRSTSSCAESVAKVAYAFFELVEVLVDRLDFDLMLAFFCGLLGSIKFEGFLFIGERQFLLRQFFIELQLFSSQVECFAGTLVVVLPLELPPFRLGG